MDTPGEQNPPPSEPFPQSQPQYSNEQQAEYDRSETVDQEPEQFARLLSSQERDILSGSSSSTAEVDDTEMMETEKSQDQCFENLRQDFKDILNRAESILTEKQWIEAIGTRLNRLAIDKRITTNFTVQTVASRERRAASYDEVDKAITKCLAADPAYHIHPAENPDSDIRTFFRLRQVAQRFVSYVVLNQNLPIHELFHVLEVMADEAKARVMRPSLRLGIEHKARELRKELQRIERFVGNEWEVIPGKAGVPVRWHCELGDDGEHMPGTVWKKINGVWVSSENEPQQVHKWKRTGGTTGTQSPLLLVPTHLHNRLHSFRAVALGLISDIGGNVRLVTLVDCITSWLNNLAQVEEARSDTHADQNTTDAADVSGEDVHGTPRPDEASLRISALRGKAMRAEALQIYRERLGNKNATAEDRWRENAQSRKQRRQERIEKELCRRRLSLSDSSESGKSRKFSLVRGEGETKQSGSELEIAWSLILEAQTWTEGDRVREWRDCLSDERLQLLIDMDETSRQNIHDESEEWDTARMAAGVVWRRLNEMQHENRDFTFEAYQATLRAEQLARQVKSPGEDGSVESEMADQTRKFGIRGTGLGQRSVRFTVGDDHGEPEAEDEIMDLEGGDSDSEDVQVELMRLQEENLPEDEETSTQRLSDASDGNRNLMDLQPQRRANEVYESSGLAGNPTTNEATREAPGPALHEGEETDQSQKPGFTRPAQCQPH